MKDLFLVEKQRTFYHILRTFVYSSVKAMTQIYPVKIAIFNHIMGHKNRETEQIFFKLFILSLEYLWHDLKIKKALIDKFDFNWSFSKESAICENHSHVYHKQEECPRLIRSACVKAVLFIVMFFLKFQLPIFQERTDFLKYAHEKVKYIKNVILQSLFFWLKRK